MAAATGTEAPVDRPTVREGSYLVSATSRVVAEAFAFDLGLLIERTQASAFAPARRRSSARCQYICS